MPSSHLILCHPLLFLPLIPPSIRIFSNESTLHMRWPKYWSLSFSISPSKEHPGLISFRMHWLDLLAVQGTLKSLFQHHSSKASILQKDNRMQCKALILSFNNLRKQGFIQTPHYTRHNCRWRCLYCCLYKGTHRPVGKRGPLPVLRNINEYA